MHLLDDEADYIQQVFDRARQLIHVGVWEGIQESRLDAWIGSLKNFDAELLAAFLLDNLSYRSRDQFFSLLDALFDELPMPDANGAPTTLLLVESLQKNLVLNPNSGVRIAPVIGSYAPPTKSGPYILRLAQRRYRLHSDWLIWPHLLAKETALSDIYFLDDFCGTGDQFDEFFKKNEIGKLLHDRPGLRLNYLVTTMHGKGLKAIQDAYPMIKIKWAERLDGGSSVLSTEAFSRYRVDGFENRVREQYQRLVEKAGLPQPGRKIANGYGELGLAYGFAHSTPNNTLPIFWMETPSLTPLLDR